MPVQGSSPSPQLPISVAPAAQPTPPQKVSITSVENGVMTLSNGRSYAITIGGNKPSDSEVQSLMQALMSNPDMAKVFAELGDNRLELAHEQAPVPDGSAGAGAAAAPDVQVGRLHAKIIDPRGQAKEQVINNIKDINNIWKSFISSPDMRARFEALSLLPKYKSLEQSAQTTTVAAKIVFEVAQQEAPTGTQALPPAHSESGAPAKTPESPKMPQQTVAAPPEKPADGTGTQTVAQAPLQPPPIVLTPAAPAAAAQQPAAASAPAQTAATTGTGPTIAAAPVRPEPSFQEGLFAASVKNQVEQHLGKEYVLQEKEGSLEIRKDGKLISQQELIKDLKAKAKEYQAELSEFKNLSKLKDKDEITEAKQELEELKAELNQVKQLIAKFEKSKNEFSMVLSEKDAKGLKFEDLMKNHLKDYSLVEKDGAFQVYEDGKMVTQKELLAAIKKITNEYKKEYDKWEKGISDSEGQRAWILAKSNMSAIKQLAGMIGRAQNPSLSKAPSVLKQGKPILENIYKVVFSSKIGEVPNTDNLKEIINKHFEGKYELINIENSEVFHIMQNGKFVTKEELLIDIKAKIKEYKNDLGRKYETENYQTLYRAAAQRNLSDAEILLAAFEKAKNPIINQEKFELPKNDLFVKLADNVFGKEGILNVRVSTSFFGGKQICEITTPSLSKEIETPVSLQELRAATLNKIQELLVQVKTLAEGPEKTVAEQQLKDAQLLFEMLAKANNQKEPKDAEIRLPLSKNKTENEKLIKEFSEKMGNLSDEIILISTGEGQFKAFSAEGKPLSLAELKMHFEDKAKKAAEENLKLEAELKANDEEKERISKEIEQVTEEIMGKEAVGEDTANLDKQSTDLGNRLKALNMNLTKTETDERIQANVKAVKAFRDGAEMIKKLSDSIASNTLKSSPSFSERISGLFKRTQVVPASPASETTKPIIKAKKLGK